MGSERRPGRRARLAACALVAAGALTSSLARADEPTLSDRETARSLMMDGDAKREAGDAAGALKSYRAADAIMHVPTTALEVAHMQAKLGELLEARETLARLMRLPVQPKEPAPFTAAREEARTLYEELGARVPSITVVVRGPGSSPTAAGVTPEIAVDGDPIPAAAARAPRKVNPGTHSVTVKANGTTTTEQVTVAESETKTVTFELTPPPPPPAPPPEPPAGLATRDVLLVSGFGVAAVGLGVGSITGLMSISKVGSIRDACGGDQCPADKQPDIDSAKTLGTVSTIAFVAGGIGLAAGVAALFLPARAERAETGVKAAVGPGYVGLRGAF